MLERVLKKGKRGGSGDPKRIHGGDKKLRTAELPATYQGKTTPQRFSKLKIAKRTGAGGGKRELKQGWGGTDGPRFKGKGGEEGKTSGILACWVEAKPLVTKKGTGVQHQPKD